MEATLNQGIYCTETGYWYFHFSCHKTVFQNTGVPELGDVKLQP